jgi:hypothetical protein
MSTAKLQVCGEFTPSNGNSRGQSLVRGCMVEVMRVLRSSDNASRLRYCRVTVPLVDPFVVVLPITELVAGLVPAIVPPPAVLMPVALSVISE